LANNDASLSQHRAPSSLADKQKAMCFARCIGIPTDNIAAKR
jgi:hypothetical protein